MSLALGQLEGPCVLQVLKVRNVSAPKDHEESQGAPRMLRLQMTDGHTTCVGLEFKHLSKIRYPYNSILFRKMMPFNVYQNCLGCLLITLVVFEKIRNDTLYLILVAT